MPWVECSGLGVPPAGRRRRTALWSTRRHFGTPAPDDLTEDEFIDWIDQLQVGWVDAARRFSPRLVVEMLAWFGPRLGQVLASENLTERSARVTWAGPELVPVWLDQLRELSEYWVHRQQLLEALARPVDLDPVLLRPILLGLRWAYPYRLSQAAFQPGDAVRIRIGVPLNEDWLAVSDRAGWTFGHMPYKRIVAETSLSADDAWRLLTNNQAPSANLPFTGDPRLTAILNNTRAVIGHPK
jgi:hypothetical protein